MMTPAQSLAAIRDAIRDAMKAKDLHSCRLALIKPLTLAQLGAEYASRDNGADA